MGWLFPLTLKYTKKKNKVQVVLGVGRLFPLLKQYTHARRHKYTDKKNKDIKSLTLQGWSHPQLELAKRGIILVKSHLMCFRACRTFSLPSLEGHQCNEFPFKEKAADDRRKQWKQQDSGGG